MGGGNDAMAPNIKPVVGLSPRGRGKPCPSRCIRRIHRSIPAWAGETAPVICISSCASVYPRVGGGNVAEYKARRDAYGLSPRGRGKRRWSDSARAGWRSIPAWAGET